MVKNHLGYKRRGFGVSLRLSKYNHETMIEQIRIWSWKGIQFVVSLVLSLIKDFFSRNGPYIAAAISFYTMLCLFPLTLLVLAAFSLFLGQEGTQALATIIIEELQRQLPILDTAIAESLVTALTDNLSNFSRVSSVTSILLTFLASTAVFSSIRRGTNTMWGITKSRSFLIEKLMDILMIIGGVVVLFLTVAVSTISSSLDTILNFFNIQIGSGEFNPVPIQWMTRIAVFFITTLVFATLYWWLPQIKIRFVYVLPSAFGAAIAFEITKSVFLVYISTASGALGAIYGTFAAVIVFLTFMFVSAIILLVGALATSKFVFYFSTWELQRLNNALSKNLSRVRSTTAVRGLPAPAPSGAASDTPRERRYPY